MPVNKKSCETEKQEILLTRLEGLIAAHGLLSRNDPVIVGVSAGPDSLALLHLLSRIRIPVRLFAVYVDHGLRPEETGREFSMVTALCNELRIPAERAVADVRGERKRTGTSIEDAARIVRYRALEAARRAHGAAVIAVAHTADDQAEEVLIRLIRGSGRMGLSGMAFRRDTIIRPLLQEKKQTLIDYLQRNAIPYCLDSSNREGIFLRNRVRLDLLPYLEQGYNSAIRQTLLQTAEILTSEEELLVKLAEKEFCSLTEIEQGPEAGSCLERIKIRIQAFLDCHPALQRRILEKACWMMSTRPGFRQIEQIRHLMTGGGNGAQLHLAQGLRVRKSGTEVLFSHPSGRIAFRGNALEEEALSLTVSEPGIFSVADHVLSVSLLPKGPEKLSATALLLDAGKATFPLRLRSPVPGERFRPLGAPGRKKVHRFLTDARIPREERRAFPVLLSADRIIAVAGLRIEHDCRVTEDTRSYLLIEWRRA